QEGRSRGVARRGPQLLSQRCGEADRAPPCRPARRHPPRDPSASSAGAKHAMAPGKAEPARCASPIGGACV
ncbi:MAG: hypothetical protein ACK56I_16950, partial [bacterium]